MENHGALNRRRFVGPNRNNVNRGITRYPAERALKSEAVISHSNYAQSLWRIFLICEWFGFCTGPVGEEPHTHRRDFPKEVLATLASPLWKANLGTHSWHDNILRCTALQLVVVVGIFETHGQGWDHTSIYSCLVTLAHFGGHRQSDKEMACLFIIYGQSLRSLVLHWHTVYIYIYIYTMNGNKKQLNTNTTC